jgi:hypothetical protein
MPHPFFDALVYPWARPDANTLHVALYSVIRPETEITLVYNRSGGTLPRSPGLAAHLAWTEVLDRLTAGRRLQALCDTVLAETAWSAAHPAIRAVLTAVDAVDTPLLASEHVFLDRKPLRAELKKLATDGSPARVLLVRGPSGSGKSWTQLLVADVARSLGAESVYLVPGVVSTVDEVVDNLFSTLGNMNAIPPRLETDDAWYRKVCVKLQELGQQKKVVTWVVVDDLGDYPQGPRLDLEIRRFFEQFALQTASPAFARWFRLVLLDYPDGSVPTKWKNFWVEDRPSETHVNEAPLKEYLLHWATRANKQLGEEKATEFAKDIMAKVATPLPPDEPAPPLLRRIHDEVDGVLKSL